MHYAKVFAALNSIKDRKDWTLEISLYPKRLRERTPPFDLSNPNWVAVRDRVLFVSLSEILPDFERIWVIHFLWSVSENLRVLTLDQESAWRYGSIFRRVLLPKLTHLVV
jgi:hypothetical protein